MKLNKGVQIAPVSTLGGHATIPTKPKKGKRLDTSDLRMLLEFRCAYCGLPKSERPPVWCVREHETFVAEQRRAERDAKTSEHHGCAHCDHDHTDNGPVPRLLLVFLNI